MGKADKAREELGWLKVVFAVSAAVDTSLLGWLAQKYSSADVLLIVVAILVATGLTADLGVRTVVSELDTDPWTLHTPSRSRAGGRDEPKETRP